MRHEFLSDAWWGAVDELIAGAGELRIPTEMRAVFVNITVSSPRGEHRLHMRDGLFARGHSDGAPTSLALSVELARKIFIDADTAAGVQAFLSGEMTAEGDLAKLVAMQTVEPSEPQKALTKRIAAITA
jgi:hypothetical protein